MSIIAVILTDTLEGGHELVLLLLGEGLGDLLEEGLPVLALKVGEVALDVAHASVDAVLALDALLELESKNLGVLTEVPNLNLASSELDTVNAGLLASADTDHLTVLGVANRVRLGVLESDGGHGKIALGVLGDGGGLGGDNLLERLGGDLAVVAALHESLAEHLAVLVLGGLEAEVGLEHNEATLLLGLEDLKGIVIVAGGHDTVTHLSLEHHGGILVHDVGESGEVTKGRHGVSLAGTEVGEGGVGEGKVAALHLVSLVLDLGERDGDGSTGGADVLEGGSGGNVESGAELTNELPGVGGVEEVDVTGVAVEHLEGHRGASDAAERGGSLVRVAAVLERSLDGVGASDSRGGGLDLLGKVRGDGTIVLSREGEGGSGEGLAEGHGGAAVVLTHSVHEGSVLGGAGHDGHGRVVLGSSAEHGGATNVDVLHAGGKVGSAGDGLLEGVEVEHDHVDSANAVVNHVLSVFLVAANSKDTTVDLRVERLDATVEHLRGTSHLSDVLDDKASIAESLGGTASGEELNALLGEELAKGEKLTLVTHTEESALHLDLVSGAALDGSVALSTGHGGER